MDKKKTIRTFKSGATRDTEENKHDYEGYIHPINTKRFGEYMSKHQKQANGELRDSDNWQKLFGDTPEKHCNVCIKSLCRHLEDLRLHHRGWGHEARESIEDAIQGIKFNINAYEYGLEIKKLKEKED